MDDPGPLIGQPCDACGQPCNRDTAPLCADCYKAKPGALILDCMNRMLARAARRTSA